MTLPRTLAELQAMGRDVLGPLLAFYANFFGIGGWDIRAEWVDAFYDEAGNVLQGVAGMCWPDPVYERATIQIIYPPLGDVEETIAHEVAHCPSAHLAMLANAAPGTEARTAWERLTEQNARGAVDMRRYGERRSRVAAAMRGVVTGRRSGNPKILARAARAATAALAAARSTMSLTELIMQGGAFREREDVPPEVKDWIAQMIAEATGDTTAEPDPTTDDGIPPAMATDDPSKPTPPVGRTVDPAITNLLKAARADAAKAARYAAEHATLQGAALRMELLKDSAFTAADRRDLEKATPEEVRAALKVARNRQAQGAAGGDASQHRQLPPGGAGTITPTKNAGGFKLPS